MQKMIKKWLYPLYISFKIAFTPHKKPSQIVCKCKLQQLWELLILQLKEGGNSRFYLLWNLHHKNNKLSDYLGGKAFLRLKHNKEQKLLRENGLAGLNYDILCKDKYVNASFLRANGIPCVDTLATIIHGETFCPTDPKTGLKELLEQHQCLFVKSVAMEASEGVRKLVLKDGLFLLDNKDQNWDEIMAFFKKGIWIVQKKIENHVQIKKMNSTTLNTCRIVTILNGNNPEYLGGFHAFAREGATTDSWEKGSIYVGIDVEKQCLKGNGYRNPWLKEDYLLSEYPGSGLKFEGFEIPFLKQAVQLCIKAHKLLYNNFIIGWDVVITDQGPLILETNEKPGMNVVQLVDGGLAKQIKMYCGEVKWKADK